MSKVTFAAGLKARHHLSVRQAMITARSQVHPDAGAPKAPAEVQGTETIVKTGDSATQHEAVLASQQSSPKPV